MSGLNGSPVDPDSSVGAPDVWPGDPLPRLCALLCGKAGALPPGPEGAAIVWLAKVHRVHLALACSLGLGPGALASIGGEHAAWLAGEMRRQAAADAFETRELALVLTALEAAGLAPIVFKGAALAHTHYLETWLRPRLDTDLLVPPGQQSVAIRALESLGYVRSPFVEGKFVMYQRPLTRPGGHGGAHVIDLHWRIANREAVAHVLSYDELASRAQTVDVLGQPMRVPAADHALLLACVHRAAHHHDADDLLWLFDIHLLVERMTPMEWERFVTAAVERAVREVCLRGLRLAAERFGADIPENVAQRLAESTPGRREASAVFLNRGLRPIDLLTSDVMALGPMAGTRLVWEVLFPPASYMDAAYGAVRGVGLWAAYGRRILGGLAKWLRSKDAPGAPT